MSPAVLLFLAVSMCAFAQSDRGALSGQVTDPSGAGIPGADVQALNLAIAVKSATKSLENGSYLLGALPFGSYDVTVSAAGFSKLSQQKVEISFCDTGFPPWLLTSTISPTVANGSSVNTMLRSDGRAPYSHNWSFGFEQELPGSILAEADYVGVKSTHLGNNLIDLNQLDSSYLRYGSLLTQSITSAAAIAAGIPLPYAGFKGTVAQALRPYPQFLSIPDQSNPNGNSTYNALQTKAEKRFSKGVTFLVAYTFSKTISDSDILAGGGPSRQTYYNRKLEKALSTNDVPQIFAANVVYELPFGPGKSILSHGVPSRVLGGWMITGTAQYQVGRPIPLTANNTFPLFNSTRRPNVIAGVPLQNSFDHFDPAVNSWINAAAFQVPAPFTFGTAARDYSNLRAPAFKNQSVGLSKKTLLAENVSLTFRAEFFNVFNRVVFAAPASNISAANFGKISSKATAPRQGQVSLRLEF